ncbi:MAG: sulfur globule protein precursor [Bradyrhizobium sp.]|uniref:sulfur globule protein precursor n=1 Tax=Bradyrhizobium sp. TaxID=376 RepID=UPI001D9C4FE1|nr:sulfur globule protein precursor [Bradyrhizobium sp.]MBV9560903.1 sulfur globule protein precursor [Bradyrhizobium sp.]
MFRKLSLVAVAAISLGAAALAPSPAAAWGGWHGGWHPGWHGGYYHAWYRPWGWGPRYYASPVYYGYGGCYVRRVVPTPWGPRWRLVNRCY